jgi:hypothetical protein
MKNWLKIILILIVLGAVVGGGVAYFLFNKPHQDVIDTKPAFEYTANTLVSELAKDTAAFNLKTNGQVIQVSGPVRVVTPDNAGGATLLLEAGEYGLDDIRLQIDSAYMDGILTLPTGKIVTIKGIYTGHEYEDVLESWTVDMNRCVMMR